MAADAIASNVTMLSEAMVLIIKKKLVLDFHEEIFQKLVWNRAMKHKLWNYDENAFH